MTDEVDVEYEEVKLPNGMFRVASRDVERPRDLTPPEKIALERKDALLTQKAESRQETCWRLHCDRSAEVWVREVGFDFKGDRASPVQHIAVSSGDYPGPIPGFCSFCLAHGPEELAEAVYFDRPEIWWGVTPTRWSVIFTDGLIQHGTCVELNLRRGLPTYKETHV